MKNLVLVAVAFGLATASNAFAGDAKEIFTRDCVKCHGEDGKGQTKMGGKVGVKDFTAAEVQAKMDDAAMAKAIKEGIKDSDGKVKMKPYGDTITDEEIKTLVELVRAFKP